MDKKILVSLASTDNPDWDKNIADLKKFGIDEFALFVTLLPEFADRQRVYKMIKTYLPKAKIPFCHIHQNMTPKELNFLISDFRTKLFNIHPTRQFPLIYDYHEFRNKILMENSGPAIEDGLKIDDVEGFGGICLDLSHLETSRLHNFPGYKITLKTLEEFPIRANHVSAISLKPVTYGGRTFLYDIHRFDNLNQFDYLKKFPLKYFADTICLEVINPIAEQIEAKKYIENILGSKLGQ